MPKKRYTSAHDFLKGIMEADLSDQSRRIYLERWRTLLTHFQTDVFSILTEPKKYITWIKKTYDSPATQKSYLSAVLAMFRHNDGLKEQRKKAYLTWYNAFTEIHQLIDDRYKKNQPSDKQVAGYVPFDDIVKKRDELDMGTDERLLLSVYTHIPPLRCDFNAVRIYEEDELPSDAKKQEKNFIHLREHEPSVMVLHEFKTAGSMEPYKRDLPPLLVKEIQASLLKNPRTYLFEDRSKKPYRASSYNKWANRTLLKLFGKNLTISLIRHSYINSLDFNKITVEDKERIAKDMTHTVGTQDRYRLIFDNNGKKDD